MHARPKVAPDQRRPVEPPQLFGWLLRVRLEYGRLHWIPVEKIVYLAPAIRNNEVSALVSEIGLGNTFIVAAHPVDEIVDALTKEVPNA
jgi:hypothetical protein